MRYPFFWPLLLLISGANLRAQPVQPNATIDIFNFRQVPTPASAEGIAVDPVSEGTMYVATPRGLYVTQNGGSTWTRPIEEAVAPEAIAIDPVAPNRVYAAGGPTVYISHDRGQNWEPVRTFPTAIQSLFVSARDQHLFAGPSFSAFSGIYRSPDTGRTWSEMPFGTTAGIQTCLDIEEDSSGTLYVAAEPRILVRGQNMILKNSNRSARWDDVTGGPFSEWRQPPRKLFWDPSEGSLAAMNESAGLWVTTNGGVRWSDVQRSGVRAYLPASTAFGPVKLAASAGSGLGWAGIAELERITLPGVLVLALTRNRAGTRIYAAAGEDGIYVGATDQPRLLPTVLFLPPRASLVARCLGCANNPPMTLQAAGTRTEMDPGHVRDYSVALPASVGPGIYAAQLTSSAATIRFTLVVGDPNPVVSGLVSVRFAPKENYAPGELVTLFGSKLTNLFSASPTAENASQRVPWARQLAFSQVLVDGQPAALHFAYSNLSGASQINFQIPATLLDGVHEFRVDRLDPYGAIQASSAVTEFVVRRVSPTYFGNNVLPILIQNLTQSPAGNVWVTGDTPARRGDVGVIYATGLGLTEPVLANGAVPPPGVTARVLVPTLIQVEGAEGVGINAAILGAVASPQFPGLYQIAFRFPEGVTPKASGQVDLTLAVGADTQKFAINFAR